MFPRNPFPVILVVFLLLLQNVFAQNKNIEIGHWRTHPSYNATSLLAFDGQKIYASPSKLHNNATGTMFSIDGDGEINKLSKENGLSEFGIAQLGYSENTQVMVVAYENGNIDFIKKDGSINNLSDIKTKEIAGLKSANHLYFYKELCFISYDFGMCIVNLQKLEITETITKISKTPGSNSLRATAIANGTLYVLSDKGIFKSNYSSTTNLMDIGNWSKLDLPFSFDVAQFRIASFNNSLYVGKSKVAVYKYENNQFISKLKLDGLGPLKDMTVSKSQLLVTTVYLILSSKDGDDFPYVLNNGGDFFTALYDNKNTLWASTTRGLVKALSRDTFQSILPNSPQSNICFKSYYNQKLDELVVVAGGYDDNTLQLNNTQGYYVFKEGIWKNFNLREKTAKNRQFIDIIQAIYNPNTEKYYFASFGFGIAELNPKDSTYIFYDTLNSSINNVFDKGLAGMRVNALELEGNDLWVGTHLDPGVSSSLHLFTQNPGKIMKSKPVNIEGLHPYQILVDSMGLKWIRNRNLSSFPLTVYNSKTNQVINLPYDYLSGTTASTSISRVYSMELDRKGQMWVGTDKGIAIISETANIGNYKAGNKAYRPIFDGFPLLYTEQILCIQVDGANRKWVGTNNGVWLLSEDGSEVINRFTVENSPLPLNKIIDIEIMGSTGEVFFSTDVCLVSYRGTATLPNAETSGICIFPSPVPPDYGGLVSISCLPANECTVKITDEVGTMVHEMKSTGGSAIWNGKNYSGSKAKSGMYLVFTSDKDGKNNFVGKFAIVE